MPTLKELGYDVEFYLWVGLFAPKGTPATVITDLREDRARRRAPSSSRRRSPISGRTPAYLDQPDFAKFWDADAKRVEAAVHSIGKVEGERRRALSIPKFAYPRTPICDRNRRRTALMIRAWLWFESASDSPRQDAVDRQLARARGRRVVTCAPTTSPGGVFVALGIVVFALSGDLPFGTLSSPGAGMLPKLMAGLMIALRRC